ncbi:MAG: DUF3011 domain-containing protein [Prochloraceae cyanobacterium]
MNMIGRFTLIAGIITLGVVFKPTLAEARRSITCESQNGRYKFCPVDTRGGVELRRQLSNASCNFNRSWGYDRRGIWVDRGCRARFVIQGRDSRRDYRNNRDDWDRDYDRRDRRNNRDNWDRNYDRYRTATVNCSSNNNNYARCPVRINGRAYLKRQLSRAGCREGSTWGYDRRGIWVDRGCRGEFEIER